LQLDKLTPDSARKYGDATPDVLLSFARKGVETLVARLARLSTDEAAQAFRRAAQALGLHRVVADRLHAALHIALHDPETLPPGKPGTQLELTETGGFSSVVLQDEPLFIQVGARGVTVRWDYKGELVVMMPGLAPMVLHDLLVARLPVGNLLLVRHGSWLGAALTGDLPVVTLEAAELSTEDIRVTN